MDKLLLNPESRLKALHDRCHLTMSSYVLLAVYSESRLVAVLSDRIGYDESESERYKQVRDYFGGDRVVSYCTYRKRWY